MKQLKFVLAALLALSSRGVVAQTSAAPVEPIPAATAPAAPVPTLSQTAAPSPQAVPVSPAPQAATAAPAAKVTSDFSGWLIMQSFYDQGGLNTMDLPKNATTAPDNTYANESATGFMVRQSRFRWNLGLPSDGFMSGATLKGLAEFDFAGSQGADISSWMPRIRHAFVTATWKDLNNLQLLVGQTWGVAPGPYFAESITHVIMPRFGGAGFLFRRAPQVRLSGNLPVAEGAGLTYTAAVLTPDVAEGQRSGMPHLEGRISANYKQEGKQLADVGFFAHFGKKLYETYDLTATTKTYDSTTLNTQVVGVDAKISVPYVSVVGAYFTGKNIDTTYASIAPAATTLTQDPTTTDPTKKVLSKVADMKTNGFFGQATVTPIQGVALVAGYGQETPDKDAYAVAGTDITASATKAQIVKNAQISGGVILNVTSKWRVGLEYTQYSTEYTYGGGANPNKTFDSSQVELGTLFAF